MFLHIEQPCLSLKWPFLYTILNIIQRFSTLRRANMFMLLSKFMPFEVLFNRHNSEQDIIVHIPCCLGYSNKSLNVFSRNDATVLTNIGKSTDYFLIKRAHCFKLVCCKHTRLVLPECQKTQSMWTETSHFWIVLASIVWNIHTVSNEQLWVVCGMRNLEHWTLVAANANITSRPNPRSQLWNR